jgi:hypothetical protein
MTAQAVAAEVQPSWVRAWARVQALQPVRAQRQQQRAMRPRSERSPLQQALLPRWVRQPLRVVPLQALGLGLAQGRVQVPEQAQQRALARQQPERARVLELGPEPAE